MTLMYCISTDIAEAAPLMGGMNLLAKKILVDTCPCN